MAHTVGSGRPGWHLECSAMAVFYLGQAFDIHCGGLDLVFPHHENEIAQAKCAGDDFAQYWLHNGWVTKSGEKMSKSLGNVLSVPNVLKLVRPQELRYYLGSAHYRSMLEYSEEALQEAAAGTGVASRSCSGRPSGPARSRSASGPRSSRRRSTTTSTCLRPLPRSTAGYARATSRSSP